MGLSGFSSAILSIASLVSSHSMMCCLCLDLGAGCTTSMLPACGLLHSFQLHLSKAHAQTYLSSSSLS